MAYPRLTRTKVTPNAKIESLNIQTFLYDGTTEGSTAWTPAEGDPIAFSYTRPGYAVKPIGGAAAPGAFAAPTADGAHQVYINFVAGNRSDVVHTQSDRLDNSGLTGVSVEAGGLAGIRGPVHVGLSAACWAGGVLPTAGQGVFINASGKWTAGTLTADKFYYGIIENIFDGQAYFNFHSVPFVAGLA